LFLDECLFTDEFIDHLEQWVKENKVIEKAVINTKEIK